MDLSPFGVRASSGSLRAEEGVLLGHAWTDRGVRVSPAANGAHLLHLSVALCVLNDTYREADRLGVAVDGVVVDADGSFDADWRSTGISYEVALDTSASPDDRARLLAAVEQVAEVPRALRAGIEVARLTGGDTPAPDGHGARPS